jgi:hypothetical protein
MVDVIQAVCNLGKRHWCVPVTPAPHKAEAEVHVVTFRAVCLRERDLSEVAWVRGVPGGETVLVIVPTKCVVRAECCDDQVKGSARGGADIRESHRTIGGQVILDEDGLEEVEIDCI